MRAGARRRSITCTVSRRTPLGTPFKLRRAARPFPPTGNAGFALSHGPVPWERRPTKYPEERKAFLRSFPNHKRPAMQLNWAVLEDALPFVRGRTCDVGCGLQPYAPLLQHASKEVIGMDWSRRPQAIQAPQLLADVSRSIPLVDGCVDTVLASHVLEHLPDPGLFLRECQRVLSPGGHLIVLVPFLWQVHEAPHDYHRFTRYGLERHLRLAGFSDIQIVEGTQGWGTISLFANYLAKMPAPLHVRLVRRLVARVIRMFAQSFDAARPSPEFTAGYRVVARRAA